MIFDYISKRVGTATSPKSHQQAWDDTQTALSLIQEVATPILERCEETTVRKPVESALGFASTIFDGLSLQLQDIFATGASQRSFKESLPEVTKQLNQSLQTLQTWQGEDSWWINSAVTRLSELANGLLPYFRRLPTDAQALAQLKGCVDTKPDTTLITCVLGTRPHTASSSGPPPSRATTSSVSPSVKEEQIAHSAPKSSSEDDIAHFAIHRVPADGHCLFSACAAGHDIGGPQLRKNSYEFLRANMEKYVNPLTNHLTQEYEHYRALDETGRERQTGILPKELLDYFREEAAGLHEGDQRSRFERLALELYAPAMTKGSCSGGEFEILLLSDLLKAPVHVHQASSPVKKYGKRQPGTPICLLYDSSRSHYDRLISKVALSTAVSCSSSSPSLAASSVPVEDVPITTLLVDGTLDLSGNPKITDAELLTMLKGLREPIRRLNLAGCNRLSGSAIRTVISHCHQLVGLNVNNTPISREVLSDFLPKIEDDGLTEFDVATLCGFDDATLAAFLPKCKTNGLTSLSLCYCLDKEMLEAYRDKCQDGALKHLQITHAGGHGSLIPQFVSKAQAGGLASCTVDSASYVKDCLTYLQDGALHASVFDVAINDEDLQALVPKIGSAVKHVHNLTSYTPGLQALLEKIPDGTLEGISFLNCSSEEFVRSLLPKCQPGNLGIAHLPSDISKETLLDYIALQWNHCVHLLMNYRNADDSVVKAALEKCGNRITTLNLEGVTVSQETWEAIEAKLAPRAEMKEFRPPTIRNS